MQTKLVIIRGNSGSGKSTVARLVREKLGENTMLVPQDVVRREMFYVKDRVGNPAINLISKIALYGNEVGYNVVLEGILSKKLYDNMLNNLISEYSDNAYVFYMDVSFEETLRRHDTKPKRHEYGLEKMIEWWLEKDYLNLPNEYIIPENYDATEAVDYILATVEKSSKLVH
ncbi:kinase [Candidatus Saccharibacteria bacterium]|nr:kinase [Candidatus Saccharibacteria bacterium]